MGMLTHGFSIDNDDDIELGENDFKYLDKKEKEEFINKMKYSNKYYFIAMLQLECGLRVSEACSLKIGAFNIKEKTVIVERLKRNRKTRSTKEHKIEKAANNPTKIVRTKFKMSDILFNAFAKYWHEVENKNADAYMFPAKNANSKSGYISRKQVWLEYREHGGISGTHKMRHTKLTNLANEGFPIHVIAEFAGHAKGSYNNTMRYMHSSQKQINSASLISNKKDWYNTMLNKLFPPKEIYLTPMQLGNSTQYIGRKKEIEKLNKLVENKQNCVVLGPSGIGKSRLLNEITGDKVLRIDDLKGIITTLKGMLAHIILLKPDEMKLLQLNGNNMTPTSQKELIKTMEDLTIKNEFSIIIDDITSLTEVTCNVLKNLSNHFHIVCAAREMLIKFGALLSGFVKVELEELTREESLLLIRNCSALFRKRIEDYQLFEGHVYNKTMGNPNKIIKLIEVYSVENLISIKELSDIELLGNERTKSLVPFLLVMLMVAAIQKYTGKEASEVDKIGYATIAATVMFIAVVLRFSRRSFSTNKI
jgi:integrase/recombinase XerD